MKTRFLFALFAVFLFACSVASSEPTGTVQQAWFSQSESAMVFDPTQGVDDAGRKGDLIFPSLYGEYPGSHRDIISMLPLADAGATKRIVSQVADYVAEFGDINLDNGILIGGSVQNIFGNGGSTVWVRNDVGPVMRLTNSAGSTLWKFDLGTYASAGIGVWDRSVEGAGVPLTLSAQNHIPGVAGNAARVDLVGGERGQSGYNRGGFALRMNGLANDDVELEGVDVGAAHRIVAFCGGATYSSSSAGAAPGDRVVHVMPAATAPDAGPAAGVLLYVDPNDGNLKAWRADAGSPSTLTP